MGSEFLRFLEGVTRAHGLSGIQGVILTSLHHTLRLLRMHRESESKAEGIQHNVPLCVDENYLQSIFAGPWEEWIMDPGWIKVPNYHISTDMKGDTRADVKTEFTSKKSPVMVKNAAVMMMGCPDVTSSAARVSGIKTEEMTQFDKLSILNMFKHQEPIVKTCYEILFSGSLKFHDPDKLREHFLSDVERGVLTADWLHSSPGPELPDLEHMDLNADDGSENVRHKMCHPEDM